MFARMLVHENAGVAGYSEAFMYGQSGKQASIGSSYLITDVLVPNTVMVVATDSHRTSPLSGSLRNRACMIFSLSINL